MAVADGNDNLVKNQNIFFVKMYPQATSKFAK